MKFLMFDMGLFIGWFTIQLVHEFTRLRGFWYGWSFVSALVCRVIRVSPAREGPLSGTSFWHVLVPVSSCCRAVYPDILPGVSSPAAFVAHPQKCSLKNPLHLCFMWIF